MIYLAAVGLVLGVLVFVHEFGHYAVAKLCGVRVEVFSLGFGKRLWGFRRGDTDYRISLLPLGGYVKMSGENPMEVRTGDPGEFTSHPRWQRFLIAIAGPAMNVILAIAVLTVVYMFHFAHPASWLKPAEVVYVDPDSPAQAAGIVRGDRIIGIDKVQNPTWEDAENRISINPNQRLDVTLQRGAQTISTTLVPKGVGSDEFGVAGLHGEGPAEVIKVDANTPAARVGIEPGDQIVSLNGIPLRAYPELSDIIQGIKNSPVEVTLLRDGRQFSVTTRPELLPAGPDADSPKRYRLGTTVTEARIVSKLPLKGAFVQSIHECKTNAFMIFELLGKMIERPRTALKQVSGPIGITIVSGQAAKAGFWPLMWVMAMISLNLAVFNLLPIPILDGGLMLMLIIEGILRRDVKQQIKERVYQAAFVFLILFAAVVIYNDVAKTLSGHLL